MHFKLWLEAVDKVFKRGAIDTRQLAQMLALPTSSLTEIDRGSFATVYQHPAAPNRIIKVTKDRQDVVNLVKAQRLNSPCVVRLYPPVKSNELFVKVGQMYAIVADKVQGPPMPYTSNAIAMLLTGKLGMDTPQKAAMKIQQSGSSPFRDSILAKMGRDNEAERAKLSELFFTLAKLERMGVDLSDFTDNVLDGGQHYVIIDMGL